VWVCNIRVKFTRRAGEMIQDLKRIIEQVSRDKGIERDVLIGTLEEAMRSAARKRFGHDRFRWKKGGNWILTVSSAIVSESSWTPTPLVVLPLSPPSR
jgi:hypothetical protein